MKNRVLTPKDMQRGMVVLPFWGESTFNRPVESLNWEHTLRRDYWTHTVISVDETTVRLARPYAYAHEHFDSNQPLLGCEVYTVQKDSTHPYMLLREGFTS